jgi:hypothetical protein
MLEGKRALKGSRRRWENDTEIDLRWEGVDWIHLAQDHSVDFVN